MIVSPSLCDELRDVLCRPKFRRWISAELVAEFVDGLADAATAIADPPDPPSASSDPDDDYLIALARSAEADYLVSGDRHLLDLVDPDPSVLTPRQFLDLLERA